MSGFRRSSTTHHKVGCRKSPMSLSRGTMMPSVFYQTRHFKNRKTNRKRWAYTLCDVSYYSATLCPPCHTSILRQPPVRGAFRWSSICAARWLRLRSFSCFCRFRRSSRKKPDSRRSWCGRCFGVMKGQSRSPPKASSLTTWINLEHDEC